MPDLCALCDKEFSSNETGVITCTEKGILSLIKYSVQRGDHLQEKLRGLPAVRVHYKCQKDYTRRIKRDENVFVKSPPPAPLLRSSAPQNFSYKTACFLCAREVPLLRPGGPPRSDRGVSVVTAESVRLTVLDACKARTEEWVRKAAIRVNGTSSLVKENACYHRACFAALLDPLRPEPLLTSPVPLLSPPASTLSTCDEFKTPAKLSAKRPATSPADGTPSRIPVPKLSAGRGRGKVRPGRPSDERKMAAFDRLCQKLESEDECQYTLADLVRMMPAEGADTDTPMYSEKHLERLLKERYSREIKIVERPGKSSILCFLGGKFDIVGESWYMNRSKNEQEERRRIVLKAAEIVRSDILKIVHEPEFFPAVAGTGPDFVPASLTAFLEGVTLPQKKGQGVARTIKICEVLAHSLISATRPRSFVSPIMLGLGVWVHRKLGSRTLCDILHTIGSSVPYSLIQEYEKSAVIHSKLDFDAEAYIQFAFDNFDFNTATIDGHDTIHSMGGMIFVTPKTGVPPRGNLPRLTSETRKIPLAQFGVIPLQSYRKPPESGLSHVTVTAADVISVNEARSLSALKARQFDLLWLIGKTAMPKVIPGWHGFMSSAMEGPPYALTATLPLPFVNLNPSDPSTIFTCLSFAADQADKHGQKFIPVTFDQPLYWKAAEMVLASPQNSPLRKVVVRLGGFHLLMSFMGSIGHLMSGSGLEDLWATVYAKNSVQHMCSAKAFARAVRAHFLTQTALLGLVLKEIFTSPDIAPLRKTLLEMCRSIYRRESTAFENEQILSRVLEKLDMALNNLAGSSKTGRLWVQYIRQVELMRLLIRAERVGDWGLHLHAVKQMLPYFHAAGHLNYAKSAHLYLQLMAVAESSLPQPELDRLCFQGFFSVRKNDRLWAGNFSDQTIEMDYMRPMKSIGGITMHGRGITASTLAVWVGSMPYCSEVVQALEVFCGVARATSEQHVDLRDSTISRDAEHLEIFTNWLESHSPFDKPSDKLVCLSSGLIANNSINCDRAYEIGCEAMAKHVGKPFSEVTFHRKDKAVPISAMSRSVVIRDNAMQVNPTQLFHRIIVALKDPSALEGHFSYELAPFPTALFDETGMRKTAKSKLVDAVESLFVRSDAVIPPQPSYVIDGGFLLRKVVWPRPATYGEVIEMYKKHVLQFYGSSATVVFDGYPEGPTTKDQEHNLRSAAGTSADLSSITPSMVINDTQARLLSNGKNKSLLIQMLTDSLHGAGVAVFQAKADADRLVVSKAIEIASSDRNCVVVGTDTDLLVLLVGLSDGNLPLHFLIPASGRTGPRVHHIQCIHAAMGDAARNILVAHVITGTDTVSALYMGQKKKALKLLCKPGLDEVITFLTPGQSPDAVAAAGEKILLALYGCKDHPNLNKARFFLYLRVIARQSVRATFKLESLPPTTAGARQHSLRTYFQIQEWLGKELNPIEWGWKLDSSQYFPVTTLSPAAPKELLELISCNCRSGCGRGCSCVAAGLKCSNICGHCAGNTCVNAEASQASDEEVDGEEDDEDPDDPPSFAL